MAFNFLVLKRCDIPYEEIKNCCYEFDKNFNPSIIIPQNFKITDYLIIPIRIIDNYTIPIFLLLNIDSLNGFLFPNPEMIKIGFRKEGKLWYVFYISSQYSWIQKTTLGFIQKLPII